MSLRSTNLNLIPVLRALLKEGSVTAAAKSVGLTQPATSNALARLREVFGDPLLHRVGQQMKLTPRARRMAESLEQVCRTLEELLDEPEFDPARAERTFVVTAADYVAVLLGSYLAERLAASAPGISVRFVETPVPLAAPLLSGDVDLAIFRWTEGMADEGLSYLRGYQDRMVGLVRKGHPLAGRAAGPDDLAAFDQVRQQRISTSGPRLSSWPLLPGAIRLSSPQFVSAAAIVAETDTITAAPRSLANALSALMPLDQFELPAGLDTNFESALLWGPVNDTDAQHRWFRSVMDDAVRARGMAT